MSIEHWWNDTDRGKPKYSKENLFYAHLSTINPMWTSQGSNPGLHNERLANNQLSRLGWSTNRG
jgi:hypothetical protein